jgi:HEPN domain-containing protein
MLRAAERDVLTLQDMSARVPDESFGFHVQQATEKALKALLALLGRKYPLTHNLYDLFVLVGEEGVATGFYRPLSSFTPYAVEFRYEGVGPGHEPIDRAAAVTLVEALVRDVQDRLGTTE